MPAPLAELSPAEWAIMQVVWDRKEVVARDVHDALKETENWAPTTVRTMMDRLAKKGYLRQRRIGPVFLYTAAVDRRRAIRLSFKDLLDRLSPSGARDLVAYAVEDAAMTPDQLDELEKLIKARKERRHGSR